MQSTIRRWYVGTISAQVMNEDDAPQFISFAGVFSDVDVLWEGDTFTSVGSSDNPGLVNVVPVAGGAGVTLALAPDRNGTANIQVALQDAGGLVSNSVFFTLTVNPVNDDVLNDNPVPDQTAAEDDGTVTLTIPAGVFSDVDSGFEGENHTVSVVSTSDPSMLISSDSFSGLAGTLDFTLTPDMNGPVTVTIAAEDDELPVPSRVETSFLVTIDPRNDPPFLSGDVADLSVAEDSAGVSVDVLSQFDDIDFTVGTAPDSHTPIFISNDNPALLSVVVNGSGVDLQLTPNAVGQANIVVGVEDEAGAQATDTFLLTVTAVNDPVVVIGTIPDRLINEDAATISVNTAGVFDDIDLSSGGDTHTITVTGNSNPALVTPVATSVPSLNGIFQFNITPDLDGNAVITLEARDAAGSTAQVSFNIDVVGLDDPPFVANPLADQTHTEDAGNLSIDFTGVFDDIDLTTQTDIQSFAYSLNNPTLVTSASISGTSLVLGFGQDQNGTVQITLQVTDKGGLIATDTFDLVVAAVPDAPVVVNPIGAIGENEDAPDTLINLSNVFDDPDIATNGDTLAYTVVSNSNPALFNSVTVAGSTLTLDYANNQFGSSTIVIEARDTAGLTVTDTFTVSVSEVYPIPQDDVATMNEDGAPITIDVLANDFLGEEPTVFLSIGRDWPTDAPIYSDVTNSEPTTQPDAGGLLTTAPNGYLAIVNGMIEYTPKENFSGTDYFEYSIQDADGDIATAQVTVTVLEQNDAPRAFAIPEYTVNQGSFLNVLAEGGLLSFAVDDDGDPLEVRYLTVPTQIAVGGFQPDLSGNGAFRYTPLAAYGSVPGQTDSFQIYYWDETDGLASPPVTVVINFDPDEGAVAPPPAGEVEYEFDLADVPLEDAVAAEANVLVMMDDSGSMDWSVMTPEDGGEFRISNAATRRNGVSSSSNTYRYTVQLNTNIYGGNANVPTEETLAADTDFDGNDYGVWRARNSQYSTIYYNPEIRYTPWIGLDRDGNEFADVNPNAAPWIRTMQRQR